MPRLRLKSSFNVASTEDMSACTSSRLTMFSTRAALMLTLAVCPFALASMDWGGGGEARLKAVTNVKRNERSHLHAGRLSMLLHIKARQKEFIRPLMWPEKGHFSQPEQARHHRGEISQRTKGQ